MPDFNAKEFPLPVILAVVKRQRLTKSSTRGTYALLRHVLGKNIGKNEFARACVDAGKAIIKQYPNLGNVQLPKSPIRRDAENPMTGWMRGQQEIFGATLLLLPITTHKLSTPAFDASPGL